MHFINLDSVKCGSLSTVVDVVSSTFCVILFQIYYTSENVVEGKSSAKRALQDRLGLHQTDAPLVGIISRLTAQKGIHLIKHAIYRTLERNGQVLYLAYR
jgi:glycogen synthase